MNFLAYVKSNCEIDQLYMPSSSLQGCLNNPSISLADSRFMLSEESILKNGFIGQLFTKNAIPYFTFSLEYDSMLKFKI